MGLNKYVMELCVKTGTLVEIVVKEGSVFNTETSTVPTYHGPIRGCESIKGTRNVAGYVCEMTDKTVSLVSVWDNRKQTNGEQGYIGGVNIDYKAMQTFCVK